MQYSATEYTTDKVEHPVEPYSFFIILLGLWIFADMLSRGFLRESVMSKLRTRISIFGKVLVLQRFVIETDLKSPGCYFIIQVEGTDLCIFYVGYKYQFIEVFTHSS